LESTDNIYSSTMANLVQSICYLTNQVNTICVSTAGNCVDGVQNQNETGVDCGGPCAGCEAGLTCIRDSDCRTSLCTPAWPGLPPSCQIATFVGVNVVSPSPRAASIVLGVLGGIFVFLAMVIGFCWWSEPVPLQKDLAIKLEPEPIIEIATPKSDGRSIPAGDSKMVEEPVDPSPVDVKSDYQQQSSQDKDAEADALADEFAADVPDRDEDDELRG